MDYGRESGNVVQINIGGSRNGGDYWGDQPVWATEDEYRVWDRETSVDNTSNSNYDGRQSQTRSGSEPPIKKRTGQGVDAQASNRSKAIGKMFFKTKLCCKFRAGTCPYVTNCNFAHSIEELRRPPSNWQEIVAAHEEDRPVSSEPREEFQIPSLGSSSFTVDSQRSYKGRHCKKFYTEEGCPYGDSCTFLHDEQSKSRESVVISLGPGSGGGYGGVGASGGSGGGGGGGSEGGGGGGVGGGGAEAAGANSMLKPSNWKTRICNKWEQTGYCPFGTKCHFAHGAAELHQYGGGPVDIDAKDSPTSIDPNKQGTMLLKTPIESVVAGASSVAYSDGYHVGVPSQRLPGVIPRTGQRPFQKWKGPNKISRIYGDWIDDVE